jgi:hypothetical protein
MERRSSLDETRIQAFKVSLIQSEKDALSSCCLDSSKNHDLVYHESTLSGRVLMSCTFWAPTMKRGSKKRMIQLL